MGTWTFYASDIACGQRYGNITGDNPTAGPWAVDSDQETVWTGLGATGTLEMDWALNQRILGYAIGNHTILGAQVLYQDWNGAAWVTRNTLAAVPTREDFLVNFGASLATTSRSRIAISGSPAAVSLGTLSFLVDSGYSNVGVQEWDTGRGVLAITLGGPRWPIDRGLASPNVMIPTAGRGVSVQRVGGADYLLGLSLDAIQFADQASGWPRFEESWRGVAGGSLLVPNAGWGDGVWVTDDTYNGSTNLRAYYCRPLPGQALPGQIRGPGLSGARLVLQTISRGV